MLVLVLGFTAWQAVEVRSELNTTAARLSATVEQLADDDAEAAAESLEEARSSAASARRHTRGPVWWTAARLPWVGDDVTAVRVVAEVADSLADDTLPGLVEVAEGFGPRSLAPRDGRIRLRPIAEAAPRLSTGARQLAEAQGRVDGLETEGLMEPIAGPVVDLQDKLGRAVELSTVATTAAELLPAMLGADGQRNYLLAFQNNAEIRAQGGMLGAAALISVDDGRPEIRSQIRPAQLGTFPADFIDLTADERRLFSTRLSVYPQNAVFVPDFPRASEILTRMWEERRPEDLHGMVSLDPVALSYLLRATGPVTLDNGQRLSADNAVDYLLRDVYQDVLDGDAQNALYDDAARKTFDAVLGGGVDATVLVDALTQAVQEHRIKLWSADEAEQARLLETTISGALTTTQTDRPAIGVYLNDSAADKLSYYLDYEVDVTPRACVSAGIQTLDVEVTMTSTVPPGAELSSFVIGPGLEEGVAPGTMRNSVYFYAPVKGTIVSARLGGDKAPMLETSHHDRPVGVVTLDLAPGETRTLSYRVRSGAGQTGDPRLTTTPAALTTGHGEVGSSGC